MLIRLTQQLLLIDLLFTMNITKNTGCEKAINQFVATYVNDV